MKVFLIWLLGNASEKSLKVWMLAKFTPKMERKFVLRHPNHLSTKIHEFLSSFFNFQQVTTFFHESFFFTKKWNFAFIWPGYLNSLSLFYCFCQWFCFFYSCFNNNTHCNKFQFFFHCVDSVAYSFGFCFCIVFDLFIFQLF